MRYEKHRKTIQLIVVILFAFLVGIFLADYFNKRYSDIDTRNLKVVKIGLIDGERLKSRALCFKTHEKIAEMVSKLLEEMRKDDAEAKKSYVAIKNDPKLSVKQRGNELSKVEARWNSVSKRYNQRMQSIRNLDLKLSEFIQKNLDKVIASLSKRVGLDIIINKRTKDSINVFYNSEDLDITDIVVKKMDEILPSVDLKELEKE